MRVITKIYLINLILLAFSVVVVAVGGISLETVAQVGAWGGYTVLATPVWLVLLVLTK